MNQYLPFNLPEEIFRLNSASPYDAYALKAKIEEFLAETKIARSIKENISYGSKIKYFDTEKMDEDGIYVENIEEKSVSGIRQSDQSKVTVPIEALSLEPLNDWSKATRKEFDGFDAPFLSKIAIAHWNYGKTYLSGNLLMLGYMISNSYNTRKVRLLGGDIVKFSRDRSMIYYPEKDELQTFDKVENDKFFIAKEFNRTMTLAKERSEILDIEYKPHITKLSKYLLVRGCAKANVEKVINQLTSEHLGVK